MRIQGSGSLSERTLGLEGPPQHSRLLTPDDGFLGQVDAGARYIGAMRYLVPILSLVTMVACNNFVDKGSDAGGSTTDDAGANVPDASPDVCDGTACDPNATCESDGNGAASICKCNEGYEGSGTTCTDIDECNRGIEVCDVSATCVNTVGSFSCACTHGLLDEDGDGSSCVRPPNSGVCLLRANNAPNMNSPPIGSDYVFHFVPGVNDITGLRAMCTAGAPDLLKTIETEFCALGVGDVQRSAATVAVDGSVDTLGCADFPNGCLNTTCP